MTTTTNPPTTDPNTLYRVHHTGILRYCCTHINDPAEAEDVAQEVWIKALTAIRRGTQPNNPAGWLTTIARHLIIDYYRARQRYYLVVSDDAELEAAQTQPSRDPAPYDHARGAELTRHIRMALQTLTIGQAVAVARDLDGYDGYETAEYLGVSYGAGKQLLRRGRVRLRQALEVMQT